MLFRVETRTGKNQWLPVPFPFGEEVIGSSLAYGCLEWNGDGKLPPAMLMRLLTH